MSTGAMNMNGSGKVATVTVLKKDEPHMVQQENIRAAGLLSGLIRSCVGPRAMLKMILTRIGTMELTNDGNSILREMEVSHPVIKSLVELSRTQSEEVGDGTTTVVILASEILQQMLPLLREKKHPVVVSAGLKKALEHSLGKLKKLGMDLGSVRKEKGVTEDELVKSVISDTIGTKFSRHLLPLENLAVRAIKTVAAKEGSRVKCDIKSAIKIEKIPGGLIEESEVMDGIIIQKEVLSPSMSKAIQAAKILLVDFPLEYRKGENHMHIEMHTGDTFERALRVEEEQIEKAVRMIEGVSPSLVASEKGISDHAISLLCRAGITGIRRVRKSDLQRLALATGAQIVSRPEDISAKSLGHVGAFECVRIGDEFFCKFLRCATPRACSILLRGQSRDILNELERNLQDALYAARNLLLSPAVVHGAGAVEMAISRDLEEAAMKSPSLSPAEKQVFHGVAKALQVIPSILISNSGNSSHALRKLVELEAHHRGGKSSFGVDGVTGEIKATPILESILVKEQLLKSAVEGALIILRVDGIIRQK